MTNEEAITMLKSKMDGHTDTSYEWAETIRMAIKALEQLQEKPEYIDIWNVGAILRNVPEQPDICKIYGGVCGYPIEACSECPKHEGWRPSKEQTIRWIPIKTRPLTEEEKEHYISIGWSEDSLEFIYDCPLPDDGQEVLITDSIGNVELDTFYSDDGCYFENNCDADEVIAWMPLPQPYAESEEWE